MSKNHCFLPKVNAGGPHPRDRKNLRGRNHVKALVPVGMPVRTMRPIGKGIGGFVHRKPYSFAPRADPFATARQVHPLALETADHKPCGALRLQPRHDVPGTTPATIDSPSGTVLWVGKSVGGLG